MAYIFVARRKSTFKEEIVELLVGQPDGERPLKRHLKRRRTIMGLK
jgi:hypothetical protein